MKKIITAVVFILLLFKGKAQLITANYIKEFVSDSKSYTTNKNFAPYDVNRTQWTYSQVLKNSPFRVNVSASRSLRKPPPLGLIKPPIDRGPVKKFTEYYRIEADSISTSSEKESSIDFLVGFGYIIIPKENSKFVVSINADFGFALNSNTTLDFFKQGKLVAIAAKNKTQFVINPNIQAKYFLVNMLD
jgi:hypothetical protein